MIKLTGTRPRGLITATPSGTLAGREPASCACASLPEPGRRAAGKINPEASPATVLSTNPRRLSIRRSGFSLTSS